MKPLKFEIVKCGYLPSFNIAKPQLKYLTENSGSGQFSAMKPERNGSLENQPEHGTERTGTEFRSAPNYLLIY